MVATSDIISIISNSACIRCGKHFKHPRVGKLYCSPKCKQFAYYHKDKIASHILAHKAQNETVKTLPIKEYAWYIRTCEFKYEWERLKRRQNSNYLVHEPGEDQRICDFEKLLPNYIKNLCLRKMPLESWAFFKVLYPDLNRQKFIKLNTALNNSFLDSLIPFPLKKTRNNLNPLQIQYNLHLSKIAAGKIKFI